MAIPSGAYKKALANMQKPKDVLVEIRKVSKSFDDTVAVDEVSIKINKGEIFALLGGSGSGKSTLLRMLAGFETPTEGKIYLDGVDITDRSEEHTSELQSRPHLVCRLLLEKKKKTKKYNY